MKRTVAGLKSPSHAHGAEGIINAPKAGADMIEHASFIDDEGIRIAIENDAALSMDIFVDGDILGERECRHLEESLEKERKTGATQRANFRKAVEAGANDCLSARTQGCIRTARTPSSSAHEAVRYDTAPSNSVSHNDCRGGDGLGL